MNSLKSKLVDLRNFYQNQINTNISSILMKNNNVSSPLFKPFYLDFVNYIPYFILKAILNFYNIDYLYETDGLVKYSKSDTNTLCPIILSFDLINERGENILNLKNITKNYSNNIKLEYIIKNEYLKHQQIEYNFYIGTFSLFSLINNYKKLTNDDENKKLNLEKAIIKENLKISIKTIKNAIPTVETFEYSSHKSFTKNQLLIN